jgi:hypothetical protein
MTYDSSFLPSRSYGEARRIACFGGQSPSLIPTATGGGKGEKYFKIKNLISNI